MAVLDTRKIEQWFTNLGRSGRLNGDGEARIDLHALNLEPPAQPKPRSFSFGIEEELNIFASYFAKSFSKHEGSGFSACERAIQLMSELVGAVILARAVGRANPSLSDQILQVSRRGEKV